MAESPVQFGIMGCARIAYTVCRAIRLAPNATVVAIASRSLEKAKRFRADNGVPDSAAVYGSYEALLDDPSVQAVYMPLPTSLHLRWAVAVAEKKKHVLLEKPVALSTAEFDMVLEACEANGVQFMDGTMWLHHPRTAKMEQVLSDPSSFGNLKTVHCTYTFAPPAEFFEDNLRVKPDLDALGALGDAGWYGIGSSLWAANFELPRTVVADRDPVTNESGVILACGATLYWEDGRKAKFDCSFLANLSMELSAFGTRGTLHLVDYVIPFEESSASFTLGTDSWFAQLGTGWEPLPGRHVVSTDGLPQEARMVAEFSRLVVGVRDCGAKPDPKWAAISRKTQLVVDAVKVSIDNGFEPVNVTGNI